MLLVIGALPWFTVYAINIYFYTCFKLRRCNRTSYLYRFRIFMHLWEIERWDAYYKKKIYIYIYSVYYIVQNIVICNVCKNLETHKNRRWTFETFNVICTFIKFLRECSNISQSYASSCSDTSEQQYKFRTSFQSCAFRSLLRSRCVYLPWRWNDVLVNATRTRNGQDEKIRAIRPRYRFIEAFAKRIWEIWVKCRYVRGI